jgi:hypothetical protein
MTNYADVQAAIATLKQEIDVKRAEKNRLAKQCEQKRYYLRYKERKIAHSRQWYEAHKRDTYLCPCCNKQQRSLTRAAHERTTKHKNWLASAQVSGVDHRGNID